MDRERFSRTDKILLLAKNQLTTNNILHEAVNHDIVFLEKNSKLPTQENRLNNQVKSVSTDDSVAEINTLFVINNNNITSKDISYLDVDNSTNELLYEEVVIDSFENQVEEHAEEISTVPENYILMEQLEMNVTEAEKSVNEFINESVEGTTEEINTVTNTTTPTKTSSEESEVVGQRQNKHKKRNIKRKKNKLTRKEVAELKAATKHAIREGCKENCKKQCNKYFNEEDRILIHSQYWNLNWTEQRNFILNICTRKPIKRRTTIENDYLRNMTFIYRLKNRAGEQITVCKTFFLTTLGYKKNNDKFLFNVLHKSKPGSLQVQEDRRGKHSPPNKIDRNIILNHVESFHPTQSHYRREHAPRVKYLPNDVTVSFMHEDFISKHPEIKCSYEAYRKILFDENIRFTKLGHEQCESSELMDMQYQNHSKENLDPDCNTCQMWSIHINKANIARNVYKKHKDAVYDDKTICVSADLEKIIMLPRMESFKKVLFTQRLVMYNETFVPVGVNQKNILPLAAIWHEAIRGRGKEEIISTFFQFFLQYRDTNNFIIWLDNCAAQNKNWAFMSFLIYIVNSSKVEASTVEIFYFEPGHTFMSADAFHHQIELSLKRQKKTCDFNDFIEAVRLSNKKKVNTKDMNINDFYEFKDFSSVHKRNGNKNEKILLSDIVYVKAKKGSFELEYKTSLESDEVKVLNFLRSDIYKKKKIPEPISHTTPYGVSREKKNSIIKNLLDLMPANRKDFWLNLPVNQDL